MDAEIKQEFVQMHEMFAEMRAAFRTVHQRFDLLDQIFATKEDLIALELRMDAKFATKADLETQTEDLKAFAEEQTEILAQIIETTVAEPLHQHFRRPAW